MRPTSILLACALLLLAMPSAAAAQEQGKTPRIGYVRAGSAAADPYRASLVRGLRDLGYVEGRNIAIEFRYFGDDAAATTQLVNDLVRLKVDVIVAGGTHAARAAQQATKTIPIVMLVGGDPIRTGFVVGLARPGGNITGIAVLGLELVGKRLQLLKEAVPGATRIALLRHPGNSSHGPILEELGTQARALGLTLRAFEASRSEDFPSTFAAVAEWPADAALPLDESTFIANRVPLVNAAVRQPVPLVCGFREMTEAGCLFSYAVNLGDTFYRIAKFVDKILKGAKPAEIPVEQPVQFELVINLKTAKALGITVPPMLLARADEVIE